MKKRNKSSRTLLAISLMLPLFCINCSKQTPIPSLREQGTAKQLIVDGKPFVALCGELGNNNFILPILSTTESTFLVEIQKAVLSLLHQAKRKKALLASNLSGVT